jgi:hypothetical protein
LPLPGAWVPVNNAVSTQDKPIEGVDDADLDRMIRSGIYGSPYTMQATPFAARYRHSPRSKPEDINTYDSRLGSEMRLAQPLHQASRYVKVTEVSGPFRLWIAGRMPM